MRLRYPTSAERPPPRALSPDTRLHTAIPLDIPYSRSCIRKPLRFAPNAPIPGDGIFDRLGMDFARYACHNIEHHHLAAGPCPAHNNGIKGDGKKPPRLMPNASFSL